MCMKKLQTGQVVEKETLSQMHDKTLSMHDGRCVRRALFEDLIPCYGLTARGLDEGLEGVLRDVHPLQEGA